MSIEAVKEVAPHQFEIASQTDLLTDPRNNREGAAWSGWAVTPWLSISDVINVALQTFAYCLSEKQQRV
jgi:hypothetical protein